MQQDYINDNCFQATFLLLIRLGICHLHRLDSRDQRIDGLWKFCLSQVRIFFCPSHNFSLSTRGLEFMGLPVVRTLLSYSKEGGYHISQAQGADSDGIESFCSCHSGLSEGSLKTNPKCYRSSTKQNCIRYKIENLI